MKYFLSILGLAMLTGTFFLIKSTIKFTNESLEVRGEVVDLIEVEGDNSSTFAPIIMFYTKSGQDIEFKSSTSSNPPSYGIGEGVDVLYTPRNPQDAKIKSFFSLWGASLIIGIFAVIISLIGFGLLFKGIKDKKNLAFLKENGVSIEADFESVNYDTSYAVNGRSPYVIICKWMNPKNSELHFFKSVYIWFDPTDYIKSDKIKVFIDRDNPKTYNVDLSFLPKVAS